MEAWLKASIHGLLAALALPRVGLSAIFVVSLVSATLLPLGSEPAVYGYVRLRPDMFWPAVLVATLGNTLGGVISYAMGLAAEKGYERWKAKHGHEHGPDEHEAHMRRRGGRWHAAIRRWADRMGPALLLFSWLPVVGDPLCAVAGWMRLSFWPSVICMALGKFLRYLVMTFALMWVVPHLS